MPLIKADRLVEDPWIGHADDTAPLPDGPTPVIVTLERWQAGRETLVGRNGPLGIRLRADQPPSLIKDDLDRFDVVALEFPKFQDGRAFSYARLLRERYGFTGEIRAVGNVLRDQLVFMARCGFDAFEVADARVLDAWLEARDEISVVYQPAGDRRRAVVALRREQGQKEGRGGAAPAAPSEAGKIRVCAACWAF